MMGSAAPPKDSPSAGDVAPIVSGCDWIVPRQGAMCFASNEGSISPPYVAPMSLSTSGSLGCTGVLVIMCQKLVRSRTACGSPAHGAAAVNDWPRSDSCVGAINGSGLWTIIGSSYVPGTLALMGSREPQVLKMKYCALLWAPHV